MPAERVIPRRTERRQDAPPRVEQPGHLFEDGRGLIEMLERVDGDDHVRSLIGAGHEGAAITHSRALGTVTARSEISLLDVDTNDLTCST